MFPETILLANKFFYRYGGVETYLFALADLLGRHGHAVVPFAMQHPDNLPGDWSRYFTSRIDYGDRSPAAQLRAAANSIYSFEARRQLRRLIGDARPDLAHLQHIYHQLSPSVLVELKNRGIPVVQTVHDYKPICPSYKLYVPARQEICFRCRGHRYYNAIAQNCTAHGLAASALVCLEAYLEWVTRAYARTVSIFITPSEFLRARLLDGGIAPSTVVAIPNFMDTTAYTPAYAGDPVLFVGRLVPEKGAHILIEAARRLANVPFRIAGSGPEESRLRRQAEGLGNVQFLGRLAPQELAGVIRDASCVVVPSIWHDPAPLVIQEAFAYGKPVIGTTLGGIPEMIQDQITGFLVEPGRWEALVEPIERLRASPAISAAMGRAARAFVEQRYSPEDHYQALLAVYNRVR